MPNLGPLTMPVLYALTGGLVVAIAITQGGAWPYYVRTFPIATIVLIGLPLAGFALGNYQFIVFLHVLGAFFFVGAHSASVYVAFALPEETDPGKALSLLLLSASALDWMHASLVFLVATGIAAGFAGDWWSKPWIWLSLDILLAITAYMYVAASSPAYTVARHALVDEGGVGWDEATRKLVDRGRALRLMGTGMVALVALVALMVFKPA